MAATIGGNLALDYVGTLSERNSSRYEHLVEPEDLSQWLADAGLVDRPPAADATALRDAIRLREVLYEVIAREIDGHPRRLTAGQRRIINRAAAATPPAIRFGPTGGIRREGDVEAGLSAIARDAIALFDRDDDSVLKWCADENCTHPFLDRSRGHRRRWCEMAGCGDRAKAAAYRARQRSAAASAASSAKPTKRSARAAR